MKVEVDPLEVEETGSCCEDSTEVGAGFFLNCPFLRSVKGNTYLFFPDMFAKGGITTLSANVGRTVVFFKCHKNRQENSQNNT